MFAPLRVAFIGNSLPRRCGIATFTSDLEQAVASLDEIGETAIFAMCDSAEPVAYPPKVHMAIRQDRASDYLTAAARINQGGFDVACLQHEFGIFGGEAGQLVLGLVEALQVPLVTTLHTVLDHPTPAQRRVIMAILAASARVVVMAQMARSILIDCYGADPRQVAVIAHGIPDVAFELPNAAKARLGYAGRQVVLTFGLIGPGKGIEVMIEALPAIVAAAPTAVYVVMGATHPHLLRAAGESYRESLVERVRQLGLQDNVVFLNRFVDRPELLEHIAMCDVYVTPYLVEAQMTSGTLAYSHGAGRAVVSTPYWHAAELLADGSGVLVPFGDPQRLGAAVIELLGDDRARQAMGRRAYAASRPSTWANTARRYARALRSAQRTDPNRWERRLPGVATGHQPPADPHAHFALPLSSGRHFLAMCDDTGLFQHAVYSVPDRLHGYCIDDNARALLLCCTPGNGLAPGTSDALASRFAAFVQHGWNPDNQRFRNFMGFNRQWLELAGSEDSHGRTLWALGACAQDRRDPARSQWAAGLFLRAVEPVRSFTSPRAWAFALLGLDRICAAGHAAETVQALRGELARRLVSLLLGNETPGRVWFEDRLTYDNARICEALIRTGAALDDNRTLQAGLRSLRWLARIQTAPPGHFRPVGSHGFMLDRAAPALFDQQPLEAAAMVDACAAAHRATGDPDWRTEARRAFAWFGGANDLALPLVDLATGSCRDGLHPDRANENRGAESVLSWLLALAAMRRLEEGVQPHTPRLAAPAMA